MLFYVQYRQITYHSTLDMFSIFDTGRKTSHWQTFHAHQSWIWFSLFNIERYPIHIRLWYAFLYSILKDILPTSGLDLLSYIQYWKISYPHQAWICFPIFIIVRYPTHIRLWYAFLYSILKDILPTSGLDMLSYIQYWKISYLHKAWICFPIFCIERYPTHIRLGYAILYSVLKDILPT
jgi:hypothetical protein